jgi:uncharacterized protein YabE (DUF348 family)
LLRSVKYGVIGAVAAGVVGGVAAFSIGADGVPVALVVDGHRTQITTTAQNVEGVLSDAGYQVGPHDLVAPGVDSKIDSGDTIVYRRGRQLHLSVDGAPRIVWTTAPTVQAALADLGYSSQDFVSVSRSKRLPLTPTALVIRAPKRVAVAHDKHLSRTVSTAATVRDLLTTMRLRVDSNDIVRPALSTALKPGMQVVVKRVELKRFTRTEKVAYGVKQRNDSSMIQGQSKVVRAGIQGTQRVTYLVRIVDGKRVERTVVARRTVSVPRTQVVRVGTKQPTYQNNGLNWDGLASCESGGNWHINTGNGFYGGLQFDYGTWQAYGGGAYASTADGASREQQIDIATRLYNARGSSPWPVCGQYL